MENLIVLFENIGIKDFIDIIIVSVLIYQFLLVVRGTRSFQMMLGIIAVALLFWGSVSYELYAVNWILAHFFDSFFIIVMILFQDNFKAALVSVGTANVFNRKKIRQFDVSIDEVVEVCQVFSKEQIGALIVFERKNGLNNFKDAGTKLNCEIHSDVIYSLFQITSPLHDGAIIVADGKIASAGCFLPLSKNIELDKKIGTRHRAALGISEVSDAVVVVVSEETGKISICFNGIFYRITEASLLRRQLRQLLTAETPIANKEATSVERSI